MKVLVEKMSNNKNTYRTPLEFIDRMPNFPKEGYPLVLQSSSHESGGIITSVVKKVSKKDNLIVVETLNSAYLITIC